MKFDIILAADEKNGIGKDNNLPWRIPSDLAYFHKITTDAKDLGKLNAVVMGKNTWFSLPANKRPLENRVNCILSRELEKSDIGSKVDDFVLYFKDLEHCLSELKSKDNVENIFIIGGAYLYNSVLDNEMLEKVYLTRVKGDYNADTLFTGVPEDFKMISYTDWNKDNGHEFRFEVWEKI